MANLVTGAMGNLVPELYELLKKEYKLQTSVKKRISSLTKELECAQAALNEVAELPWDQVNKQVQLWAREVREASYDMEDVLDTFLVRVQGPDSPKQEESFLERLMKFVNFFKTSKKRRQIGGDVEDIMTRLQEVTKRCRRYKVHDIVDRPTKSSPIDPRLHAMYNKVQDLVGIDESRAELISKLQPLQRDGSSNRKMKIVSVVGVGGLGKTTLAKVVYDELKGDFDCGAFVSVGRNPDLQKVLQMILVALDKEKYQKFNFAVLQDITQFIDELRAFLHGNKRYLIVIDDIWEIPSWEQIKLAIGNDNSCGARIVITSRNQEVAETADEVYKLQPLPDDISRELFFTRIRGYEGKLVDSKQDEITIKFLKRCAGIPLAIITMASLLAGKPRQKWGELYRSIGFRSEDNQSHNTMRIVSFSYYDLPAHLRTCLLYLSAFPEDSFISKQTLVWMWVAEGFVKKKDGMSLFETGEGYFHDLVNRSMLEAVESCDDIWIIDGCRIHDMVLDFIRSMLHQENFFSVVLGNEQGTPPLESNNVLRRLACHNRTMGHGRVPGADLKMEKVRSLFAIRCGIELDIFHGFTLLRVLVIENNRDAGEHRFFDFRSEHVRHLLHLRFLSISGTSIERTPEEVGCLRFLQTLDLDKSSLKEFPSPGSLPEQLVRLCLNCDGIFCSSGGAMSWLTRLTSLEELSLTLEEADGATVRDFWECVGHLNKLEHLTVAIFADNNVKVSVLPSRLRHLAVPVLLQEALKLPSCVNASCVPNLSHLEMNVADLDEHDLKMLGTLPELRFLSLELWASAKVSSAVVVIDKDAAEVYFPRLRCCKLWNAMVSCYANEEDKSISFHVWGLGEFHRETITMPSISVDKSQRPNTGTTGGGAPCNRFMPCLEVLRIYDGYNNLIWDDYIPGFEYAFPSLREIRATIRNNKIRAAIRSAAEAHPNRPAFRKW